MDRLKVLAIASSKGLAVLLALAALSLVALSSPARAETIHRTFEFSPSAVSRSVNNGYDLIYIADCDITDRVGHPQVPVKTIHVSLPDGAEITDVEVLATESEYLPGTFRPFPCQPPRILSRGEHGIQFVPPDQSIYASASGYPAVRVEPAQSGDVGGYRVAGIKLYPMEYEPQGQRLKLYSRIEVAIHYEISGLKRVLSPKRSTVADRTYRRLVGTLATRQGPVVKRSIRATRSSSLLASGEYEYVIVTTPSLLPAFAPLADWKTEKGVPATVVTTDWIFANYAGADEAEQVRNFIIDAYQTWGIVWVLLGGDTPMVPHRFAWAMDVEWGYAGENDLPADLYFADLDGDWDANGNGVYGEVDDNVDLYADIFVGRASCENLAEADAWVTKLLNYERNPLGDYQTEMLFFAEIMWNDPFTDGGVAKDLIDDLYVPSRFDPITKLYQSLGNESPAAVSQQFNAGQNIANHNGHCWIDIISSGTGYLRNPDFDALTNGARQTSFLYSIGCWPAAFDYDCIAEHFITNPNGGGIAFVGNGSYGWGSPGNPTFGYSDRYDQQFFAAIFQDSLNQLGAALAKAKAMYASHSRDENVYRWHQFEVNLLGDPETPIWTDTPRNLYVHHPDTIPSIGGEYTISVMTADTSAAVAGAMVCLFKQNDVYERGVTDADGMVSMAVAPGSDGGMLITVCAYNAKPFQDTIIIGSGGSHVDYDSHTVDDAAGGNGNGIPNPGESVVLWVTVENHGPGTANSLAGYLHSRGDAFVALADSALEFGDVPSGTQATSTTGCALNVDLSCADGHVALFDWMLTDAGGQLFSGTLSLEVAGCELSYYHHTADDGTGNGNGIVDPGEPVDLRVWIQNNGLAHAEGVTISLTTDDPMIAVNGSPLLIGSIAGESINYGDFTVTVDPLCAAPHFAELSANIFAAGQPGVIESFILAVGRNGYCTDMESGLPNWSLGGTNGMWTTTTHRSHTESTSWYCGTTGSWRYALDLDCWLGISPIVLGPNSRLTFWDWFSVPNFGVDGCHVIVTNLNTGAPDTLDFIGTGGALDSALITGNDWTKESYDLSAYPAGTPVDIRIWFTSDGEDVAEGFYIDDFCVESAPEYDVSVEPVRNQLSGTVGDTLIQRLRVENQGFWEEEFTLAISSSWSATVWNADGTARITRTNAIAPGGSEVVLLKIVVCAPASGVSDLVKLTATSVCEGDRYAEASVIARSQGGCGCPYQADFDADADIDAVDLAAEIDILFVGNPDFQDLSCYRTRADYNADGQADALDLTALIDHLFAGGPGPIDPCGL